MVYAELLKESIHEVKYLISGHALVSYFQKLWGDDYFHNVEPSWSKHIESFKHNIMVDTDWKELILVITFDYYLGPCVGLPEKVKLDFYNWLIAEIKKQCV